MKGKTGKQWPTEKGQKDKHWSAKHYTENLEPIGMNVGNPERLYRFCFTGDSHDLNQLISHIRRYVMQ